MDKWHVLEVAERRLLSAFGSEGVTRIEYVVGFVEPYTVSVWLGTATDTQREALATRPRLWESVDETLGLAGIGRTDAVFSDVVVESQETVDRDHEGSWFYALR